MLLKQQIISYKLQFALGLHSEIQAKTKGTIRDNIILFVLISVASLTHSKGSISILENSICNLAVVGLHRAPSKVCHINPFSIITFLGFLFLRNVTKKIKIVLLHIQSTLGISNFDVTKYSFKFERKGAFHFSSFSLKLLISQTFWYMKNYFEISVVSDEIYL